MIQQNHDHCLNFKFRWSELRVPKNPQIEGFWGLGNFEFSGGWGKRGPPAFSWGAETPEDTMMHFFDSLLFYFPHLHMHRRSQSIGIDYGTNRTRSNAIERLKLVVRRNPISISLIFGFDWNSIVFDWVSIAFDCVWLCSILAILCILCYFRQPETVSF